MRRMSDKELAIWRRPYSERRKLTAVFEEEGPLLPPSGNIAVAQAGEKRASQEGARVETHGEGCVIPYSAVHRKPRSLKSVKQEVWIPGVSINVSVVEAYRQQTKDALNPNIYVVQLEHGGYKWEIRRRYKHFQSLHTHLTFSRASSVFSTLTLHAAEHQSEALPSFPRHDDSVTSARALEGRKLELEHYIEQLVQLSAFRQNPHALEFLEVSYLSFIAGLGAKLKEGHVRKQAGGHRTDMRLNIKAVSGQWRERWFVLKDTYVAYIRPEDGAVCHVQLMDNGFQVHSGQAETNVKHGIKICSLSRELLVQCWTKRKMKEWCADIKRAMETSGKDFIQTNRFGSFAPVRPESWCRWFVDGAGYFDAVASAIAEAKEEIFITDWWLSPEIYLKRPATQCGSWRLDLLLKRKADEGVKVFVLLYKEVEVALGINSAYSKISLTQKNPDNIKVLRHPDHAPGTGTFLWGHHEKLVIVDQAIAFVGGLDMCYARWDDNKHRLTDLGEGPLLPAGIQSGLQESGMADLLVRLTGVHMKPGNDPATNTGNSCETINTDPESSHEIASSSGSPAASSDSETLSTRNKDARAPKITKPETLYGTWLRKAKTRMEKLRARSLEAGRFPVKEQINPPRLPKAFSVDTNDKRLWVGKDYSNFILKDVTNLDAPFSDQIDRKTTPRMPWHDIGSCVYGAPARDLVRHFVQRWNHAKTEKAKFDDYFPLLLPKSYDNITILPEWKCNAINCQVQALRSVSNWSIGIKKTEDSIHQAYLTAIRESKYFIYIENQFFITQMDSTVVINGIAQALFDRIRQAHEAGENFRVYVVMPLLPGFEGEVGAPSGYAIQAVTHWQYTSISRGGNSLLERLSAAGIPSQEYISFHGTRTHGELRGQPVSELIYIHSKMLIVDDRLCIIGSANINERSMRGSRDSETAAIFEDTEFVPCTFDGKEGQRGLFVGSLRTQVFRELLGLMDVSGGADVVADPVSDHFYTHVWMTTSAINTRVFDQVFNCIPTDLVRTFEQLADYKERAKRHLAITDVDAAREQLLRVKGYLVFLPLHFLADVDIRPPATTKEGLVPDMLWT